MTQTTFRLSNDCARNTYNIITSNNWNLFCYLRSEIIRELVMFPKRLKKIDTRSLNLFLEDVVRILHTESIIVFKKNDINGRKSDQGSTTFHIFLSLQKYQISRSRKFRDLANEDGSDVHISPTELGLKNCVQAPKKLPRNLKKKSGNPTKWHHDASNPSSSQILSLIRKTFLLVVHRNCHQEHLNT